MTSPRARRPGGLWVEIALNLAFLTGVAIALSSVVVWLALDQVREERRQEIGESVAQLVAARVLAGAAGAAPTADTARAVLAAVRPKTLGATQVTWVDPGMRVLGNSGETLPDGEAERQRWVVDQGEVREALVSRRTAIGEVTRGRFPVQQRSLAVAHPVFADGRLVGVVRVLVPAGGLGAVPPRSLAVVLVYAALATAVIAGFGFHQFRGLILRPVRLLRDGTGRVAAGEFDARVPETRDDELGDLSRAFNGMAAGLAAYRARAEDQVRSLRQVNEALVRAQQDLVQSEKMASLGRLAAGVAHEVGNPLAAVLGFTEILRQDDEMDPEMRADLLARIHEELLRIHETIRQLLDQARPDGGPLQPVTLEAAAEAARDLAKGQPRAAGVTFDLRLAGLPPVAAERGRLVQVFLNLFLNAADSTRGAGTVRARGEDAGGRVLLVVEDDGPGVPAHLADRVFEPFFTTKEPGLGTGLGLAVSRGIAEGFGGHLRLLPGEAGRGAAFELLLPAAAGTLGVSGPPSDTDQVVDSSPSAGTAPARSRGRA